MTGYKSKRAAAQDKLKQDAFDSWWYSAPGSSNNPYEADSFAYWAWEAWQAALAQPAQKPVAWGVFEGNLHDMFFTEAEAVEMAQLKGTHAEVKPLYTKEKNNAA